MHRIISTRINNNIVTAVTEGLSAKELIVTDVSNKASPFQIGDIVIGRITNIVRNIKSIFVDIGSGIEGYLHYEEDSQFFYTNGKSGGKPVVSDTILVQVEKEPSKTKSYTLSIKFTLMNRHIVLKSQLDKPHISSKFRSLPEYKKIKKRFTEIGNTFFSETGLGFIARRAALSLTDEEFKASLHGLYQTYLAIIKRGQHGVLYEKIYKELPSHLRLVRDRFEELEKIMTDDRETYEAYYSYLSTEGLSIEGYLHFYEDEKMSLKSLYSFGALLSRCFSKKIWLKSGAYILIEHTEAMNVIDVNSGKAIAGKSGKDETFLKINLEAASEIANQIKLRNLSGIIIIDFIDLPSKFQPLLIQGMKDVLKSDSVTTSVSGLTKLGLMEMTRRRTARPLHEYQELKTYIEKGDSTWIIQH